MKALLVIVLTAVLVGCYEQDFGGDQCMRTELFQRCMAILPAGPKSTHYNDWDEVVKACDSAAYSQSLRKLTAIKPECKI